MTTRELVVVQNSDFVIANPELKAKIIAASRRNSSRGLHSEFFTKMQFTGISAKVTLL